MSDNNDMHSKISIPCMSSLREIQFFSTRHVVWTFIGCSVLCFYYFILIRQCLTINICPQICFSCAAPPNQERRRFVKNKSTERINKTTHHNGFPATFILLIFVTICQVIVAVIFDFCLFLWTPHWLDWHQKRTIEPRKNWPLFCSRNSFFF